MAQRDWFDKDYYKILGVSDKASKEEIKRAYRRLAQKHHPDANKGDESAEKRFKEISEAYAVLSNDDRRKEYDQIRSFATTGGNPFGFRPGRGGARVDVGDLGDLFGGGASGGNLFEDLFGFRPRRTGQDLEAEAHLTFEEAMAGTTVEIGGSRVRVPAGVKDGARIKVTGKGGPAPSGGKAGDLYVRVHVSPHPLFTLEGDGHLVVRVPVTITEAALGTKIQVPTLDDVVTLKVPAGTRAGKTFRVKGKGAPRPSGGTGDLLVRVEVEVPQNLTKQERELLEAFASAHEATPRAHLESWISERQAAGKRAS